MFNSMASFPIAFLLTCGVAGAQTQVVSLAEAQQRALTRNWDLLAAQNGVKSAFALKMTAKEFPNPTVSWQTSSIDVDGHDNATSQGNTLWNRSYDTVVAVGQLFEIGGKRAARQASAQAGYETAQARFDDTCRTLAADTARAYIAVVLADENARILALSSGQLAKEADIARARFQAGDISSSDLSRIQLAAARDDMTAKNAAAAATAARIALEQLLGETSPAGSLVLADSLDTLAATEDAQPAEGAPAPLPKRADLVAAEDSLRQAECDLKLQRAMKTPDPTVTLQYEHQPSDAPETVGIGVSIPLPIWNRNEGAIRAAEVAREQAMRNVEKTKAQIAADIATARVACSEARVRWKTYRDRLQPQSASVRDAVAFAYERGGATLVDLLEAERSDNDTRLATAQAAADTANAAAALRASIGNVPMLPYVGGNHP